MLRTAFRAVVCYKVGTFCKMFGKDAYIMSYLFGYKITHDNKENIASCGFPQTIIPKVIAKLEGIKIDYMFLDTRNNYDVDLKNENDNLNIYDEVFEKAKIYVKRNNRIDKDALKIVFDIIDSEEQGLGIGNMTSQVLAIFYLSDLDHYIKEELKIKYYVRYQDDYLLFHESKDYLKMCREKIEIFLQKEKLELNRKTRIYKCTNNFIFLGRNNKGRYSRYRGVKRKLKKRKYLYEEGEISLNSYCDSLRSYEFLCGK